MIPIDHMINNGENVLIPNILIYRNFLYHSRFLYIFIPFIHSQLTSPVTYNCRFLQIIKSLAVRRISLGKPPDSSKIINFI